MEVLQGPAERAPVPDEGAVPQLDAGLAAYDGIVDASILLDDGAQPGGDGVLQWNVSTNAQRVPVAVLGHFEVDGSRKGVNGKIEYGWEERWSMVGRGGG